MAKIKFGALVVGARGTLGGVIYTAGRSGPYARAWSRGSNPRTYKQGDARAILASLGPYWQALTSTQRDAWNTYAAAAGQEKTNALGEIYYASGWNWFVEQNLRLLTTGRPIFNGPPLTPTPGVASYTSLVIRPRASGGSVLTINPATFPTPTNPWLYMRPYVGTARTAAFNRLWLISWTNPNPGSTVDLTDSIEETFGDPQVGQTFYVEMYKMHTQGRFGGVYARRVAVT